MLIGVVGGGQLGRMIALAGIPLGYRFRFLDPSTDCPAAAVGEVLCGAYDDEVALGRLTEGAMAATYEFENVPARAARYLDRHTRLAPPAHSLAVAQDRIAEKDFFRECGVPVQKYRAVGTEEELDAAIRDVGVPGVLKTRRLGYDGKGQVVIREGSSAAAAWASLAHVPCIYEAFVPFEREVSIVATRGRGGSFVAHPLIRNVHREGILRVSIAPDPDANHALRRAAEGYVRAIAEQLNHVGTLAVEFFVTREGLVANEMAPRVHNSGHWTIEGAVTSQFENHVRAVAGLPLGSADVRGAAAMVNLIGTVPDVHELLDVPGAHVHLYGKEPKPGRKLGHVTVVARDHDELMPCVERLRELAGEVVQPATASELG
ncbi:MAG: 5-(carboxyamino)imidazole ribonucleotide synthase [Phycisphaerae bacterium]|nr:5-(carboxyamino)imidazole ribonucleotide synthase [Phycisphaerae bacterium]